MFRDKKHTITSKVRRKQLSHCVMSSKYCETFHITGAFMWFFSMTTTTVFLIQFSRPNTVCSKLIPSFNPSIDSGGRCLAYWHNIPVATTNAKPLLYDSNIVRYVDKDADDRERGNKTRWFNSVLKVNQKAQRIANSEMSL